MNLSFILLKAKKKILISSTLLQVDVGETVGVESGGSGGGGGGR